MKDHKENCASFREEMVSGNIFIRPALLEKKGDMVDGHAHTFDHTTIFFQGSFHVKIVDPATKEVTEKDFTAPAYLLIKKELEHEITATSEDGGLFWCVYSHRGPDGEIVQEQTPGDHKSYS